MQYSKEIDGAVSLQIEGTVATVTNVADGDDPVVVALANEEEVTKMIAEFEDADGDLMHQEGSIFGKYPQLHQFRP